MGTQLIHRLELFGELPKRWECKICHRIMVHPIQTLRGESACEECYINAKGNSPICPIDQQPITSKPMYFKDRAKQREILNQSTVCLNTTAGCTWKGNIKEFFPHNEECQFKGERCETCQITITPKFDIEHFQSCVMLPKDGKCLFKDVGCKQQELNNGDLKNHMSNDTNYHVYILMCQILTLIKQNKRLEESNESKDKVIGKLENTVRTFKKKLNDELVEMKSQMVTEVKCQILAEVKNQILTEVKSQLVQQLNMTPKPTFCKFSDKDKQNLDDVELRLQLHENTTYDGNLLWKIDNYQRRRADAITGNVKALHSAPCFTSIYGFKYCLRLYLNGDGLGKNKFISLFLVIMRSEYDNIQEWPFTKKVKFTLLNQHNRSLDIVERMVPNKDSSSFQKPVKEMNIASGCPKFADLSLVESGGFLKDDSIFIQVKIE